MRGGGNQSIDEMDAAAMIVSHGEECFPNKARIIGSLRVSLASSLSVLQHNMM